jgi:hypothetical protein
METNQASGQARPGNGEHSAPTTTPTPPQAKHAHDAVPSLGNAAGQAVDSVGTLYRQAQNTLQEQAERAPYMTLAAAAAVGFVVGGGLASPLGQRLLRLSIRQFGAPLLQQLLDGPPAAVERAGSTAADL